MKKLSLEVIAEKTTILNEKLQAQIKGGDANPIFEDPTTSGSNPLFEGG